ncbi:MAG: polysaccharide biosynthesis/export family protein [Bacteroidales bacterium]|nr:polysaccharide biosynthesis/export family protein [Bacteroidales bacterium]
MKKSIFKILLLLTVVVTLSSCGAQKKIVYLQGAEETGTFQNDNPYLLTIRPDDKLTIIVNCKEPELAAPFNMQLNQKAFTSSGNVSFSQSGGTPQLFWVDPEGYIEYPTMEGKLKVAGLTRYELRDTIQNYLKNSGYIQDPIVTVEFYNARYSVLGEVTRPGQYPMSSDRVTIFDAVAAAGDLTIFGERDKVRLVRDNEGKQEYHTLDLKDPEVIKSPYYYIQQNDVVYVEPNKSKASNREVSSLYTFGISIVSVLLTVTNIIISVTR